MISCPSLRLGALLLLLLLGVGSVGLQAQVVRYPVVSIVISNVGPRNVSEGLVRANIRVKEGDVFSRGAVDDDVRSLYGTGYFYNIRVNEDLGAGGVTLIYYLQGKPTLTEILFEGNKRFSDRKLRKKLTSVVGEPMDDRKLFFDAQEIKKMYEKTGQPGTTVVQEASVQEELGRATVTFRIVETPKVKIDRVDFVGATQYKQRKLRRQVKTRDRWMFSWLTGSGVVKEDVLEEDREKLYDFYRKEGYIDFELLEIKVVPQTSKKVVVEFLVSEGRRYRVGSVLFTGVTLYTTNQMLAVLKMGVGEIFTPQGLETDLRAVEDLFGARGFIDSQVYPRKDPNITTGTMDLVYEVSEGKKAFIEKIEIRGNVKTKDAVIRRELAVSPGEVFNMVNVRRSKQRLEGLQFFEAVETQPEETDVPDRRDLVISVQEKNTGNFTVGAGFSSVDSILGFAEVTQGNFDMFKAPWFQGGGQKFRLRVQMGAERQDYLMTFIEPWFLNRKLELSWDLYHRELDFVSRDDIYGERRTGTRLGLTRALGSEFLRGGIDYTVERVGIVDVDPQASAAIKEEEGDRLVSKVGLTLTYDTRNSWTLPDAGQRSEIRTELAGGPFGADTDFYNMELRHARYLGNPWLEGHVLEIGGRIGVIESYGNSERVPLFDRWFLGGIRNLRGYRYREVGPRDDTGEPIGGSTYWYATAEYSVPIIDRLRFAMFYDIGMVYEGAYSLEEGDSGTGLYNDNWGLGIRINLPIGPLRLDYGIPITSDPRNESNGRFQFSVGYTRDI